MMALLRSMTVRGRVVLGASVLGVIVVAYALFSLASSPSYSMLQAGIDPAQAGKMTAALDAQGIGYQLANNGTAIEVQASQLAQARVALAGQGLAAPGSFDPSNDLLAKQKLGASDFQQQVAYQHDLESQIASTIDQISGVNGASVQLSLPKDQLFADQQQPATAAVLLSGASSPDPASVRGIANLVASSVPNLKSSNVTITDGSGDMLWPTGDAATGGGASKPTAEARFDAGLAAQLNAIVARTVGPDKAEVQVQGDLNVDSTTLDKLAYATKGVPQSVKNDNESLKGNGAGGGGAAGTATNLPTYAGTGAGGSGNSNYSHKTTQTDFAVGKTVTHTQVAPGTVNKLDVALVVDPSVPPTVRTQLQQAVATAAGIQKARGDTISTSVVPFAKQTTAVAGMPVGNMLGYAKYVGVALASLLFLFFMRRHLRRREGDDLVGEPVWLRQVAAPRTVAELAAPDGPTQIMPPPVVSAHRQAVEEAVQRDPERVAQTLRAWMDEE